MTQEQPQTPDLFTFSGPKLEERDLPRLNSHARRIWDNMAALNAKGETNWYELNALAGRLELPHSTVTAIVRAFRRDANGGHTVQTKRAENEPEGACGTHLFRLIPNTPEGVALARQRAATRKANGTPSYLQGRVDCLLDLKNWLIQQNNLKGGWWLSQDGQDILAKIDEMVAGTNA